MNRNSWTLTGACGKPNLLSFLSSRASLHEPAPISGLKEDDPMTSHRHESSPDLWRLAAVARYARATFQSHT